MVTMRRTGKFADDPVFFGLFWTGMRSVDLGLIDGRSRQYGNIKEGLRRRYSDKVKLRLISPVRTLFGRKLACIDLDAGAANMAALSGLAQAAEEKALWSRYGF